jgi:hypothetical protein
LNEFSENIDLIDEGHFQRKYFQGYRKERILKCQKMFLPQFKPAYRLSEHTPNVDAFLA